MDRIDCRTAPEQYRHWRLNVDGDIGELVLDVDEAGGLFGDYELKLNSYDLGVDIELNDALQRLRFEHPGVKAVVLKSGKDRVFCAGANIRMLSQSSHAHKVNFCKFTNETRNAIEDASAVSGLKFICAINGTAAGGGYEMALATDHIILADDGNSSVSLPEVPLLAVLPGTGGLTRVADKRKVRRDLADVFCTLEEGVKGKRAVDWKLVDEIVKASEFDELVAKRAKEMAVKSDRPSDAEGIALPPLAREDGEGVIRYGTVVAEFDRDAGIATLTVGGPETDAPGDSAGIEAAGAGFWPLAMARDVEDALLELRFNEPKCAIVVFKTSGEAERVLAYDTLLLAHRDHWLVREIIHYWKRTLKRIDVTSRSFIALIEPGSCFAGSLAELAFAADRQAMFIGEMEGENRPPARLVFNDFNFGSLPMANGLSRLETRFLGDKDAYRAVEAMSGKALDAEAADAAGLVTMALDDIDWEDEIRVMLEERASFATDGLTGMEANLRFAGPETMETKIFGRLSAWQNWIFQRPDAAGEDGALKRYGTGRKAEYSKERV